MTARPLTRFLLVALFAWLGLLSAIAADPEHPPAKVAVASLFDNTFHKQQFGLTILSNDFQEKDVSAWHVPETSEAEMVDLIKQKGIGQSVAVLPQAGARATPQNGGEQSLIRSAREAGFDTLVLIRPSSETNFRNFIPGYGIGAWGKLFGPRPACPYAMFSVEVYRTSDARLVDRARGYSWAEGPCVDLKSVPWQDKIEDYADAEWATIQAAIHKRIAEGMSRAIGNLNFELH